MVIDFMKYKYIDYEMVFKSWIPILENYAVCHGLTENIGGKVVCVVIFNFVTFETQLFA